MLSSIVKRYMRDLVKTYFGLLKIQVKLDKLKTRDFKATSLSTYDFSTLYTTLPHNLIKDKLTDLIERTPQREGSPSLACNDRNAFLLQKKLKNIMHGRVKMYVMRWPFCWTTFYSFIHFIWFGTKLYRQVVGIPMGTNCIPLVADLFLFCYEMDFMMSLSDDKQADSQGRSGLPCEFDADLWWPIPNQTLGDN